MRSLYSVNSFRSLCNEGKRRGYDYSRKDPQVERYVSLLQTNERYYRQSRKTMLREKRSEKDRNYRQQEYLKAKRKFLRLRDREKEALFTRTENFLDDLFSNTLEPNDRLNIWDVSLGPKIKGKATYTANAQPEFYLIQKQLDYSIRRASRIQSRSREALIDSLKEALNKSFFFSVVKVDFSSFFESIPHCGILQSLERLPGLDGVSEHLIRDFLKDFGELKGNPIGLPRGIALSSSLAELYMKDFDSKVKQYKGVLFYSRYVDDCMVVLESPKLLADFISWITAEAETLGLQINPEKSVYATTTIHGHGYFIQPNPGETLNGLTAAPHVTYLGYKFKRVQSGKTGKNSSLQVSLTDERAARRIKKLKIAFRVWQRRKIGNPGKASGADKLLVQRIKFLATNTRLMRPRGAVTVGIYYSNRALTLPSSDMTKFDNILRRYISQNSPLMDNRLFTSLSLINFTEAFTKKKFTPFTPRQLKRINSCWKGIE